VHLRTILLTASVVAVTLHSSVALMAQPAERSAVGTLDRVDTAAMEVTVGTASGKLTFQIESGATIRQGSRTLKPADLAAHKGERVKVRYREGGGQRRTDWIMLAAPARRQGK